MADDDKKKPEPENPKGRDKAAESRVNKQLAQSENVSKRNEKKQDILAKKADILNKITQAAASNSDAKDKQNREIFQDISDILDNNNVGSKVYIDQLDKLSKLETSLDTQIKTGEKMIENDNVVRTLEDLIEENKRTTTLLTADSTAQLELQNQLRSLNGAFSGLDEAGKENAAMLQMQFAESSQALKDAIESGDVQAQDLAMKQLEQIKASAESEENRREAQKLNELANSRLYQIADATEKTAEGVSDAISGALAGAGILAGLAGLALLFIDPESFQAIVQSIIEQVGGVIDIIKGIISGDFSMVMSGLGDSWMLLTGVALALLPKVIGFISRIVKAIKVFQVFMMKTFVPGMISMYQSIISSGPVIKLTNMLTKVGTAFKAFMMNAFIPGMVKFFVGMMTTLGTALKGILAVVGPMLAPVAIITALVLGIAYGLKALSKALGFTSVFDMLFVGVAFLKDAFAHIVNAIGSIVNFILGIVEGIGSLLGFEIDLPQIPKMATDNAAKKRAEIKVKDAAKKEEELKAAAKKKEEEELAFATGTDFNQDLVVQDDMSGDMINSQSFDNALEKANQGGGDAIVTSVKRDGDNISSVVTTTTISNPFSRASSVMDSVTSR